MLPGVQRVAEVVPPVSLCPFVPIRTSIHGCTCTSISLEAERGIVGNQRLPCCTVQWPWNLSSHIKRLLYFPGGLKIRTSASADSSLPGTLLDAKGSVAAGAAYGPRDLQGARALTRP